MKGSTFVSLASALFCLGVILSPAESQAQFFKKLFNKDLDRAPAGAELQRQEGAAAKLVAQAESAESGGKLGRATSLYRKAAKHYPLTKSAAKAQFKSGELAEKDGKLTKAFDEYQEFISTYRSSSQFSAALDRQFEIALIAMEGKAASFLGLKTAVPKSDVINMFNTIISTAPRSPYAVKSQFRIGEIYQKQRKVVESVGAYQKVVDDYPGSDLSSDAAYRIANINNLTIENSRDAANVRQTREAAEDAVRLYPDSERRSEAIELLSSLDETDAAKSMNVAAFYEKRGQDKAAAIYYIEVARSRSSFAAEAQEKLNALAIDDPDLAPLNPGVTLQPGADNGLTFPNWNADNLAPQAYTGSRPTIKTRPDYLGPPAPDLDKLLEKPKMRTELPPSIEIAPPSLPSSAPIESGSGLFDRIETEGSITDSLPSAPGTTSDPKSDSDDLGDLTKALKEFQDKVESAVEKTNKKANSKETETPPKETETPAPPAPDPDPNPDPAPAPAPDPDPDPDPDPAP
jgi:outer membrane protein assembly factor BamD (BamD/ComL family)